ncbi:BON domain-containing protein [Dyadobacter sp. CY347]|uniref:BON domain-containing protein n=1 Tax=Dyadobacter sp. CY347 TaxID=2909336 RepID=UPI001F2189A3|nr:BON domain-containing protein [Dyadobacter sp. CY347]MCF2489317.1 BON domain-containing protein [Dyadobacter sp. CY347]
MKTNEQLQKDVRDAIKWEPLLAAAEIGVCARDGVITLLGTVDSYAKKSEAENAAKNVAGVRVVIEQIDVKTSRNLQSRDNHELADEILSIFKLNHEIPGERIKVKIEKSWVTLEGELQWNHQKDAAAKLIQKLVGIRGISNNIVIKSDSTDEVEKEDIERALARNWSIKEQDIHVAVSNNTVLLTGTVGSWYERDEAERQAWKAPGVELVDNELVVEYEYSLVS